MSMQTMIVAQFHDAVKSQDVPDRADLALICPLCGTVQSARDLIAAGAGVDFEAVKNASDSLASAAGLAPVRPAPGRMVNPATGPWAACSHCTSWRSSPRMARNIRGLRLRPLTKRGVMPRSSRPRSAQHDPRPQIPCRPPVRHHQRTQRGDCPGCNGRRFSKWVSP